jgi:hypothetical protein
MEQESERRLGTIRSWGRYVVRELVSAKRSLENGLQISQSDSKPLLSEVHELAQPHLAILVHKRAKIISGGNAQAISDERWLTELYRFADRWSHLTANESERGRLIEALDQIVEGEQRRLAAQSSKVPVTSRFDTSWAI